MNGKILFICTGNYYRSRFAEILFNHLAQASNLQLEADSRGLRLWDGNEGPLSRHTISYMDKMNIDLTDSMRFPLEVTRQDFSDAARVIALDETEHRKMMQECYPDLEHAIEYWHFADDYIDLPENVLPELEKKVRSFVAFLKK